MSLRRTGLTCCRGICACQEWRYGNTDYQGTKGDRALMITTYCPNCGCDVFLRGNNGMVMCLLCKECFPEAKTTIGDNGATANERQDRTKQGTTLRPRIRTNNQIRKRRNRS